VPATAIACCEVEIVVLQLVVGEVDIDALGAFGRDGLTEQVRVA
jgi:hypothetical protein